MNIRGRNFDNDFWSEGGHARVEKDIKELELELESKYNLHGQMLKC